MAITTTKSFLNQRPLVLPAYGNAAWVAADVEFASVAYASADIIKVCKLPSGYRCLDWVLMFPKIDTGTPAIAWSFGVSNATIAVPASTDIGSGQQIWGTALTAGQTVAPSRNVSSNCAMDGIYDTTTVVGEREIVLKCTTIAATYNGAGKTGKVLLLLSAQG